MIEINNLTTATINERFLKGVAKKVLKGENKKKVILSIALVGSERIKKLNKKYRKKNKITDVLTFGQTQNSKINPSTTLRVDGERSRTIKNQKFLFLPENEFGEIVICLREVKKNAKKYQTNFKKELAQVLIHGILHLLGYEHERDEREAKKMERKQEDYLSQVMYR